MTNRSQAAIIAAAIERAEKAENELRLLIRNLRDLERTTQKTVLDFDDDRLAVTWQNGISQFKKGAFAPYTMFQALYSAEDWRLSHAELADLVYGDPIAPIRECARGLAEKLEQCRCPLSLQHDSSAYWLAES